jgi:hypothetical protein
VEAGSILEPLDQRLEFFSFSLCFIHDFSISYSECLVKCVKGHESALIVRFCSIVVLHVSCLHLAVIPL